jgi:hypothetical protein
MCRILVRGHIVFGTAGHERTGYFRTRITANSAELAGSCGFFATDATKYRALGRSGEFHWHKIAVICEKYREVRVRGDG